MARVSLSVLALLLTIGACATSQQAPPRTASQPVALVAGGPDVGAKAPDFRLGWATADSIGSVNDDFVLSRQRGVVVLAFYPADFTSGCTAEMKAFTDRYAELFGEGVTVVGISADSLESHQRFAASMGMPFRLLSDPTMRVARQYGSRGESGPRRTVYVVNDRGVITYRDMRFGALDATAYERLKAAVRAAKRG